MSDQKKKTIMLGTRVSPSFYKVFVAYLAGSDCINASDLIRKILSEYIKQDAPELYREIMGLR